MGGADRRSPRTASIIATSYEHVEKLDVRAGSGGDIIRLDATDADVQQVLIDGGAGSDQFEVGSGPMLLSAIQGQVSLAGGN